MPWPWSLTAASLKKRLAIEQSWAHGCKSKLVPHLLPSFQKKGGFWNKPLPLASRAHFVTWIHTLSMMPLGSSPRHSDVLVLGTLPGELCKQALKWRSMHLIAFALFCSPCNWDSANLESWSSSPALALHPWLARWVHISVYGDTTWHKVGTVMTL